jgi:uncharacterized protein (TIGR00369 family)
VAVELPFNVTDGFDASYGLEVLELSAELARGRVAVRDELKQPSGSVHGGVCTALAEALATFGTASAVGPEGKLAVGLSNQTNFVRPITEGTMHGVATCRHRGRTTWVWQIEISDDEGRLCVLTRITIAVRDAA